METFSRDPGNHYNDVIMSAMTSQITSLTIVYSTVCWGTDLRQHRSSASLAFCEGNSPVTGEFPAQRTSNAEKVFIWWRHHVPPKTHELSNFAGTMRGYISYLYHLSWDKWSSERSISTETLLAYGLVLNLPGTLFPIQSDNIRVLSRDIAKNLNNSR